MTYWSPDGNYRPYVQGLLNHDDSGLTLSAGDTTVTLENFVVNPGSSKLYGDVLVNGQVAASNAYLFSCTVARSSRCSSRVTTRS